MRAVEAFQRALDQGGDPGRAEASVRELVALAAEVTDALVATRLSGADRERIYARSLGLLEQAIEGNRRRWLRVLGRDRRAPALVGGAALTLGAAAVGWAVLHGRRGSSRAVAA